MKNKTVTIPIHGHATTAYLTTRQKRLRLMKERYPQFYYPKPTATDPIGIALEQSFYDMLQSHLEASKFESIQFATPGKKKLYWQQRLANKEKNKRNGKIQAYLTAKDVWWAVLHCSYKGECATCHESVWPCTTWIRGLENESEVPY